jgi:hypothetical protein
MIKMRVIFSRGTNKVVLDLVVFTCVYRYITDSNTRDAYAVPEGIFFPVSCSISSITRLATLCPSIPDGMPQ